MGSTRGAAGDEGVSESSDGRPPQEVGKELRVCVIGDDLVVGVGDPRRMGWVGRVGSHTAQTDDGLTLYPLGVPGETTAGLVARWREETGRRFADLPKANWRLVIGLGHQDLYQGLSLARSRLHLANIVDECTTRAIPVFVVGPPPGPTLWLNERIAQLSAAFADVCVRRKVPYVDAFTPLVDHDDWLTDLAAGDGQHPGQAGYGLIAWLVLHGGWHPWLGLPEPTP